MKFSVVINTYNAAKHLRQTLESVKNVDEIVICDMHSNDETLTIAKEYNCKVVYFENVGFCEPARNFAIQSACNDWVLVLDADEVATPELINFCSEHISFEAPEPGILIPRKNYLQGVFMHASYPDYNLRFFRKDKCHWPPEIHSNPKIDGAIKKIPKKSEELAIIHLDDQNIGERIRKMTFYADKELIRLKTNGRKFKAYHFFTRTFFFFIKFYWIKRGYKDGRMGLVYAFLHSYYRFMVMAKSWENTESQNK